MKKVLKVILFILLFVVLFFVIGVIQTFFVKDINSFPVFEVAFFSALIITLLIVLYVNREKLFKRIGILSSKLQVDSQFCNRRENTGNNTVSTLNEPASKRINMGIKAPNISEDVKLPRSKKCKEIAETLKQEAKSNISLFYKEKSISLALDWAKSIRKSLQLAKEYEEKADYSRVIDKPSYLLMNFERDFQWKLRDVIEREGVDTIEKLKGPQRNNKRACCESFYNEIEVYKQQFSEETYDFAMDTYYKVCEFAGLTPDNDGGFIEANRQSSTTLNEVDGMDGLTFEFFCANLLRKNGFSKAETTRGSGDQGVDIVAEKDGIKYAIQCKCYSSDLGNKPVQEVFAGKSIYKCQVAAVMTNRFFTTGGKDAAQATGVLLWDRRKLQEFIDKAQY